MKKSTLIIAFTTGIGVLALVGYFLVVPTTQVSSYKSTADAKHRQLDDKLSRVYDSFRRPAFTALKSETGSDKVDIQVAKDALKDARASLDANAAAMTKFSAWPLLSWNKQYKQAITTDAAEESYVKQTRQFLADYQTLLAYTEDMNKLAAEADAVSKDLEKVGEQTTPAAMASVIDGAVTKFQAIADRDKALTPPPYLKAAHEANLKTLNKLIGSLKNMSTGARTLDLALLAQASTDVDKASAESDQQNQTFIDSLQHDSTIQHQIDSLRNLNRAILVDFAKL